MRSENSKRWDRWRESTPLRLNGGSDTQMHRHATALALHLMSFDWNHFLTLTAKTSVSSDAMFRALQRYQRHLTRIVQRSVPYFWAVERDRVNGTAVHAHALIAGTQGTPIAVLRGSWQHGYTDAAVYDATRFGALYAAKDLSLDADNYDISAAPPPRRPDWQPETDAAILERLTGQRRSG